MDTPQGGRCPDCGGALEPGHVGFASGILWFNAEPKGWNRFFPFALKVGRSVVGNWTSTPWYRIRQARQCPRCETVVVRGDCQH